jgi:flagellar biosynthesis regulator FlaF
MDYHIPAADNSNINATQFDDGVWISIHRHCGYASTHLSREQAAQLRDALIALTETADAAQ